MKTAESKSSSSPAKTGSPFFQKSEGGMIDAAWPAPAFFQKNNPIPGVQAKLNIGQPDDKYEKEADATADKVVQRLSTNTVKENAAGNNIQPKSFTATPSNTSFLQTKCDDCEQDEKLQKKEKEEDKDQLKDKVQRKPIFESNAEPPTDKEKNVQRKSSEPSPATSASPSIENNLSATKGSGSALPSQTRHEMENSFGTDFSQVKIHHDNTAAEMSEGLNAQAFTHGNDIYFNSGKYDTGSQEGKHLLAHELTHTVQQGGGVKRKTGPAPANPAVVPKLFPQSSEVVNIASGQFLPSEKVKAEITAAGASGLDVRVIVPNIAREGKVRVRANRKGDIVMLSNGYMPLNNEWADKLGGLYLVFDVKENAITEGFVSIKQKKSPKNGWLQTIKDNSGLLGGLGLQLGKFPEVTNSFSGNTYQLGVKDLGVTVGGFLDAKFSITLENLAAPKIEAQADVNVKGVVKGQFKMDNTKGKLVGEVSLGIDYKKFSGKVTVTYKEDGSIDIHGKGAYSSDKLSGEIDFVSTDLKSANTFAKDAINAAGGKEKAKEITEPPPMPAPKENVKERALAATGKLQFNLTTWFAGTVNVIVDGKGDVTVIGKIAPPGEIILFKQKDFDKELFHLQVEAGYGIPVIGTIGVFAGVILSAVAYIGPAKLYNIEIEGTYSTDPEIQKSIQISASINISAYAGLRLRAEGGFKLTILSHDLKIGVGVNADIGVKAYADARPTIGYRDPGQFYVSGTLDMIAQPMLGLSGDFFIELDTPWWSPLSDDKWVWPIFSKEWPLTDPIGLSATMKDYVLGSGVAPDIEFKKPEFDPSKFMTAMVDKQLPEKTGGAKDGKGAFKDDGSVPPPEVGAKDGKKEGEGDPKLPAGPSSKVGTKKPPPSPEDQKQAAEIFKTAAPRLEGIKGPITKADLKKDLNGIEHSVKGIHYNIKLNGNEWVVVPEAKGIESKPVHFAAIVTEEDKKAETTDKIEAALSEIDSEGKQKIADGEVTSEDAHQIVEDVKRDHPSVIQSISVIDGGETWDFEYVQRATKKITKTNIVLPVNKADLLKAIYVDGKYLADVVKIQNATNAIPKGFIEYQFRYKKLTNRNVQLSFPDFMKEWKAGKIEKVDQERKYLIENRPAYRAGLVDEVWSIAENKRADKRVFDPNISPAYELFWKRNQSRFDQWHMGHKRKAKYSDLVDEYIIGDISYDEFIKEYNEKSNYHPEQPKSNMSHDNE
jgi:hypothetical protein